MKKHEKSQKHKDTVLEILSSLNNDENTLSGSAKRNEQLSQVKSCTKIEGLAVKKYDESQSEKSNLNT